MEAGPKAKQYLSLKPGLSFPPNHNTLAKQLSKQNQKTFSQQGESGIIQTDELSSKVPSMQRKHGQMVKKTDQHLVKFG